MLRKSGPAGNWTSDLEIASTTPYRWATTQHSKTEYRAGLSSIAELLVYSRLPIAEIMRQRSLKHAVFSTSRGARSCCCCCCNEREPFSASCESCGEKIGSWHEHSMQTTGYAINTDHEDVGRCQTFTSRLGFLSRATCAFRWCSMRVCATNRRYHARTPAQLLLRTVMCPARQSYLRLSR